MASNSQEQAVAGGSSAIQAGGNVTVTNVGPSYAEVRQIVLDVFHANFFELAGEAKAIAQARAEEITEAFLSKLQTENPAGLRNSQDPDFQYALFSVQREYARSGDRDLGDLLVDVLVDRSKHKQRDILSIVLNESLSTAPKLTEHQLAVLSLVFLFKYTQNHGIGNHDAFGEYLDRRAGPFASKVVANQASYQHLEFTGCGAIGVGEIRLEQALSQTFKGLFLKGFDIVEITRRAVSIGDDGRFFTTCLNDPAKLQVRAINDDALEKSFAACDVAPDDRLKIKELFGVGMMTDDEVRSRVVSVRPYMKNVFDVWSGSPMKNLTLTSVGIAIGHANIKRLAGEFSDLAIWIN